MWAASVIQAIVYDAVGTLIHVQPSVAQIYAEVGRCFGSRLDRDDIRRRFPVAFARQERLDHEGGWLTDEARERRRWRDIVAEVLDDVTDPPACFEALYDTFGKIDAWAVDPDAAGVITAFHKRGVRQAVASNFDRRLRGLMGALPGLSVLAPIVISSEAGWRKPAPKFFAHLAGTLRLPAPEILYVGDDRINDFDGARQAGMRALILDAKKNHLDIAERLERLSDLILVG